MTQGRQAESLAATGSHDIEEDITFQQREWTVQRVGWIVMTLLVVAALLGLTGGGGPIASATNRATDGALNLRHARIERAQASTQLDVDLATGRGDQVALWIDNQFLSEIELESVRPEPIETRAGADRQIFVFAVADDTSEIQVTFQYRPQGPGSLAGSIGIVEGQEVGLRQLVVP